MHDQLGGDQDWQGDQKANVRFDILQEGDSHRIAERMTRHQRQQQQRHPGDTGGDDHAAIRHFQRIAGQVRAAEQLEQRPAEDQ